MFTTPRILAAILIATSTSLLATQADANHSQDRAALLAAVCKLKDTACSFETINGLRPMTSYTLRQVRGVRVSADQLHEAVRCQAPLHDIQAAFNKVCAYASRANVRFQRSHNFRCDAEWSSAWACVQNDIAAVRCILKSATAIVTPRCTAPTPYSVQRPFSPYHVPALQVPSHRQPAVRFDTRPEVLPPAHVPSSHRGRPTPHFRSVQHDNHHDVWQALLLSLLR